MRIAALMLCFLCCSAMAEKQPVIVAHFRDRPPDMVTYCDNRFDGPLRAVVEEAAARIGARVEWRKASLGQSLSDLNTAKVDIVPFIFVKTAEREKTSRYSETVGRRSRPVIFLTRPGKEQDVKKLDDLVGKKVGVLKGVAYPDDFTQHPNIQKSEYPSEAALVKAFSREEVDIVPVLDKETIQRALLTIGYTKFGYTAFVIDQQLDQYFLFPRAGKNKVLYDRLDEVLVQMRKDGVVVEIYESFGADAPR